jgi:hypothetical protein
VFDCRVEVVKHDTPLVVLLPDTFEYVGRIEPPNRFDLAGLHEVARIRRDGCVGRHRAPAGFWPHVCQEVGVTVLDVVAPRELLFDAHALRQQLNLARAQPRLLSKLPARTVYVALVDVPAPFGEPELCVVMLRARHVHADLDVEPLGAAVPIMDGDALAQRFKVHAAVFVVVGEGLVLLVLPKVVPYFVKGPRQQACPLLVRHAREHAQNVPPVVDVVLAAYKLNI